MNRTNVGDFKYLQTIDPKSITATETGTTIDTQGFDILSFLVCLGTETGTLSGSNKIELKLYHGDASNMSDEVVVSEAVMVNSDSEVTLVTLTDGIFAMVDAPSEAPITKPFKVGYNGIKRYLRIKAVVSGTIEIPISAIAQLGNGLMPQA